MEKGEWTGKKKEKKKSKRVRNGRKEEGGKREP